MLSTFQDGPAIGRGFQPSLVFANACDGSKEVVARAFQNGEHYLAIVLIHCPKK